MNDRASFPRGSLQRSGASSVLRMLGLSQNDRAVVLHLDDVGMCEATVAAYRHIASTGVAASASAIVPSGWFPAVAESCREQPKSDMGVHLTLTSEWDVYRWAPLLGQHAPGLCDDAGYFHREAHHVQHPALLDAIRAELRAQIRRAQGMGVDVTHLDTHMFTLLHPVTFSAYAAVARELEIPCVALPLGPGSLRDSVEPGHREYVLAFDGWGELPLNESASRLETAKRVIDRLPSGLSYLLSHPAIDSRELRAIAPDWEARVADYQLYVSDEWADFLGSSGVRVVRMRDIRERLFCKSEVLGSSPGPVA